MWRLPDPRFDVATALDQGGRDYQEDSLVTDFPVGDDCGIVVLADGMGGHAAGDIASNIVVTEVFGDLKFQKQTFLDREPEMPRILMDALEDANETVACHLVDHPDALGMGSTMISVVMVGPRMYWTSVGDSPLYHYRSGRLAQVNEDHSMAPQIDLMAATGAIKPDEAKTHPDRNCLTSAIIGGPIPRIDNPKSALELQAGDVIVVSSDGLQFLEDQAIARIIHRNRRKSSIDITNALLCAVKKLNDPEQDNISIAVIKVNHVKPVAMSAERVRREAAEERMSAALTRLAGQDVMEAYTVEGQEASARRQSVLAFDKAAGE